MRHSKLDMCKYWTSIYPSTLLIAGADLSYRCHEDRLPEVPLGQRHRDFEASGH